jgi:hypothetical protein
MQAVEQGIPGLRGFAYTDHWCGFVECVWEVGAWFCSLFHLFIVPNPDLIQRIHLPFAAIFFFQMNRSEHSGNLCGCVKNKNSNPIYIYMQNKNRPSPHLNALRQWTCFSLHPVSRWQLLMR